jgi:hypothetical protein
VAIKHNRAKITKALSSTLFALFAEDLEKTSQVHGA